MQPADPAPSTDAPPSGEGHGDGDGDAAATAKKAKRSDAIPWQSEQCSLSTVRPTLEDKGHTGYLTFATWLHPGVLQVTP